jgi:type III pantothenate kinase
VIGRRTAASLRSGIFYGAVDAIDGMVRRIKAEWTRPDALVVGTGGLVPMVAQHCDTIDRIEPHLTLIGLRLAHEHIERARTVAAPPPPPRTRPRRHRRR